MRSRQSSRTGQQSVQGVHASHTPKTKKLRSCSTPLDSHCDPCRCCADAGAFSKPCRNRSKRPTNILAGNEFLFWPCPGCDAGSLLSRLCRCRQCLRSSWRVETFLPSGLVGKSIIASAQSTVWNATMQQCNEASASAGDSALAIVDQFSKGLGGSTGMQHVLSISCKVGRQPGLAGLVG